MHITMNRKLKVAVFNTQPPHLYFGGVERRILETAKRLEDKAEVTVYSGTKRGFSKKTDIDGATVVPCSSTDRVYPLDNWTYNRTVARMAHKIEADVYEAHTDSGHGLLKALKKHDIRKPFIHTVHGVLEDEYLRSFSSVSLSLRLKLSNRFMKCLAKIEKETALEADLIVTVSRYSAQRLVQLYGVDETKIRVVPNGVDPQRFKPMNDLGKLREEVGGDSRHIILYVGTLIPRKGLHFLVEAATQVTTQYKESRFVVAGDGPLKSHLEAYAEKVGVADGFNFLGEVKDFMLPTLYNCADIVVSPSIQEGQGISLLEAQASGKPVVAFNVTAIREVVKNGKTGLLTETGSGELAEAIMKLLADESLRKRMGRAGREFVSKTFTWDVCAERMWRVYCEVSGQAT